MVLQFWVLILLGLLGVGVSLRFCKLDFFCSEKELNYLVVDEVLGVVYLGVVNVFYQLDVKLQLEQQVVMGLVLDNKKCMLFIEVSQCYEVEMIDNVNQLLLFDFFRKCLVECGSFFKGICVLCVLSNIFFCLFYEDGSGEKFFVVSNDEGVVIVGLVSFMGFGGDCVLFVGKGNGLYDNGIIVSIWLLDWIDSREVFEVYMDYVIYKVGYLFINIQQFVVVFEDGFYVFFVFNQQDKYLVWNCMLLVCMCREDFNYYFYLEMDLQCWDFDIYVVVFGICLVVFVVVFGFGRVLYVVFSRDSWSSGGFGVGFCLFLLDEVYVKMEVNCNVCYIGIWEVCDIFYKFFYGDIQCGGYVLGFSKSFLCGLEYLFYLLGSCDGFRGIVVLQCGGLNFMVVMVVVENNYIVVFLGIFDGWIFKVYFILDGIFLEYDFIFVEINKRVKCDLVLFGDLGSLYVMIQDKVFWLLVQECLSYLICIQCCDFQDFYCGWCVVEG